MMSTSTLAVQAREGETGRRSEVKRKGVCVSDREVEYPILFKEMGQSPLSLIRTHNTIGLGSLLTVGSNPHDYRNTPPISTFLQFSLFGPIRTGKPGPRIHHSQFSL